MGRGSVITGLFPFLGATSRDRYKPDRVTGWQGGREKESPESFSGTNRDALYMQHAFTVLQKAFFQD